MAEPRRRKESASVSLKAQSSQGERVTADYPEGSKITSPRPLPLPEREEQLRELVNPKLKELALLGVAAGFGLGLAWAQGEGMFAAVFAMEAALAVLGALYLSTQP
jgi:hypothetical protein